MHFLTYFKNLRKNPKNIPIKEQDEKNPINPYAVSKLKDEELAINYSKQYKYLLSL